jgi:hypothetical protein
VDTTKQDANGAVELPKVEPLSGSEFLRQLLLIQNGVVEQIAIAKLALDLDRADETRATLAAALEGARGLVSHLLDQLRQEGIPLEALLKDAPA